MSIIPPPRDPARGPALALAVAALLTIITILGLIPLSEARGNPPTPGQHGGTGPRTPAAQIGSVATGDFNLSPAQVRALAHRAGGQLVTGHGVDNAIVRGDVDVVRVRVLGRHGSDHHAILYTLAIDGHRFRVLAWNVYVGQAPTRVVDQLDGMVDRWRPLVIVLNEAYRIHRPLTELDGYYGLHGHIGEARGIALLVRRDATVLRSGWVDMATDWIGPIRGLWHGPRAFARVRLLLPWGARVRVLGLHFPTGGYGGPNPAAVREAAGRAVGWLRW